MMTTNTNPDAVKVLSDDALREIEARLKSWAAHEIPHTQYPASWSEVDALCATVRALESALRKANEIVEEAAFENGKLQLQLAQVDEVLGSCDSVLSYIYHRERSRLLPETQQQLWKTMVEVEKLTRGKS